MELFEKPAINGFSDGTDFVTVVSVGSLDEPINKPQAESGYVTVLTIGDEDELDEDKTEEVLVYRLPGERLGFGLKFEGGTKASEFVKRLFIQSCAPDSPASRVHSSWGSLTEGDEVLEIDSIPVKSMTRIDCVRCLKDSNVVIKLLVKHSKSSDNRAEDLPLIISAEKKRTPPPPPPVPPRKIPRKKENGGNIVIPPKDFNDPDNPPPLPPMRQTQIEIKNHHQSPRNSIRLQQPEATKRDRPPNAEVYLDLFSQEPAYCLSESDDTGSSISTVVDRFASFPTTTTSSFAGSLPSTPTSIQKQMDLSHVLNPFDMGDDGDDENYLFTKLISLQAKEEPPLEKVEKSAPLQPPANFQDAPLSYGDEDVRIVEASIKTAIETIAVSQIEVENNVMNDIHNALENADEIIPGKRRPPPPPPRSKHSVLREKNNNDYDAKNENSESLPRLVDFVPKCSKTETFETLKRFLENEQRVACEYIAPQREENNYAGNWSEGADFYTFNWSPSCQLATIGEDEEEGAADGQRNPSAPIVIVENADEKEEEVLVVEEPAGVEMEVEEEVDEPDGDVPHNTDSDVARSPSKEPEGIIVETPERALTPPDVDVMEAPSINSRQPPDGHEFPDYQEVTPIMSDKLPPRNPPQYVSRKDQQSSKSVRNMIAIFSNSTEENVPDGEPNEGLNKKGLSKSVMNINTIPSSLPSYYPPTSTPNHSVNRASLDISLSPPILPEKELANVTPTPRLHMRSQSLIDISDPKTKSTTDRWSLLVEQRRKGLSKLKGLIIPEHTDPDENAAIIDLPEIKSTTIPILPQIETKPLANFQIPNHSRNSSTSSIIWNTESSPAIPKYSPAFKRKSLQVYGTKSESLPNDKKSPKQTLTSQIDDECRLPVTLSINDAPKSLESITSPTRSDCSFEYISSSPEPKGNSTHTKFHADPRRSFRPSKEDAGKSEDESDNDSAVSSSQSSYISRNSPPASPNPLQSQHFATPRLEGKYELTGPDLQSSDRRLLKPQSVEAINRKNILASAKCRSGRDLKVGSPLIQRKFDEADTKPPEYTPPAPPQPPPGPTPTAEPVRNTDKPPPETNGVALRPNETNNKEKETKQRPATLREPLDNNKILPRSLSRNNGSASVTDLRKNFEKLTTTGAPTPAPQPAATTPTKINPRLSLSYTPAPVVPTPAKRNSLPIIQPPPVVTKIINNADDTKIIEDVLKDLNETVNKDEIRVITLAADVPGGSIGITLAGGADYETKEITVHKVRSGSVAFRDGRLQKGERILAINGRSLKGVTHAESIAILKEPVAEVVLVACAATKESPSPALTPSSRHGSSFDLSVATAKELPATAPGKKRDEVVVSLTKDAAGLGFSMEGGKDSPQGDVPLVIKKLFTGGIADKSGRVHVGDELAEINGVDVSAMPRIDVWTLMKKLPVGEVVLKVRR